MSDVPVEPVATSAPLLELESVDDHPGWPAGGPVTVPTPGDAPMIFAKPR